MSYAEACKNMWVKPLINIKEDQVKYLTKKVNDKLDELTLDIKVAEIVNAEDTQWKDRDRAIKKDGTMSFFAQYMEDVRIVLMNEVSGDSFIAQLLFGGRTYNREVASILSKYVIVPGMKTAKGEPVTLFSPEWVWIVAQLFFEQYCLQNGTTMKNSSPEQKEMLKIIYKLLSKKVVEEKLQDSHIAVYIDYNIIQKKNASDVQLMISQRMYGNKNNTFAVVSTSAGDSYSLDVMNKEILENSGGISYTNEKGQKMIAALLYKRNSERMSKAVDDALRKQAEEAEEATKAEEAEEAEKAEKDVPCVQSEKKRRTEAPFSTKLPIIGSDGKQLEFPFPHFVTHKTQFIITEEERESSVKGYGGTTRGRSGTRSIFGAFKGGNNREQERAEDNTINADMLKAFDGITITTCARGDDICKMPLITMKIPDKPSITLQPGNLQVNVVLCCNRQPAEWRDVKLETEEDFKREEEANTFYLVEEILDNMLNARLHFFKEIVRGKLLDAHNTTVLNKASFNHLNTQSLTEDDKLLLKNSASELIKNRFNPFESVMPAFDNGDFDIEKICQGYDGAKISDPVTIPTQESEPVPIESKPVPIESEPVPIESEPVPIESKPVPIESEPVPIESKPVPIESEPVPIESEPVPIESEPVPIESEPIPIKKADLMNFVTWDNEETIPQVLSVSLGDKPLCCSAPKIYVKVKQHDGKDDEVGEFIDKENIQVLDKDTYREVIFNVDIELLTRIEVKATHELTGIIPVYITEAGEEQPEDEISLKDNETFELPFPLQKEAGSEPDSWMIRWGSEILIKMTFILK
jgi:hypothetical protein